MDGLVLILMLLRIELAEQPKLSLLEDQPICVVGWSRV